MAITPAGRGPELLVTVGLFVALSTIAIVLRCYTRIFIVKSVGLDDYSAVAAWVRNFSILPCELQMLTIALQDSLHDLQYLCHLWRL